MNLAQASEDYNRIEKAIIFLENNLSRQPELGEVAAAANLSEYHFQRLFSRWVGISPKRFLQYLTKEHAKKLLKKSQSLLDTTFDTGLTSASRLHDLFVSCEAVTPGEFKNNGQDLIIQYGIHPTPFGNCLLAKTERGICNLMFLNNKNIDYALSWLKSKWCNAQVVENLPAVISLTEQIFTPPEGRAKKPLHLVLKGTNFQIKVWEALMRIPPGYTVSYQYVADMIGNPKAVRAVANAVANNPISFIIPCHRVIRKLGIIHEYRWGAARKKVMLGWEAAIYHR